MAALSETAPVLHLRPHHLLCIQNYRGHGYSSDFNQKMQGVIAALQSPSGAGVSLTEGADDLCMSCPHCRNGSCDSDNPALFDVLVCSRTGAAPGKTFTWKLRGNSSGDCPDQRKRTEDFRPPLMTRELLENCCHGCSWLDLCLEIISD